MHTFGKIICAALSACLLACLAAGCTSKKDESSSNASGGSTSTASVTSAASGTAAGSHKDGTYTAEGSYDDQGYKPVVKVTVSGGKLSALDCDEVKEDGSSKKSLSQSGQYGMKEKAGAKGEWHEEAALFEKAAVEKGLDAISFGSDGKTDAISGCTISVSHFAALAREALQKAAQ
ncbi:MAG: FMN-binding protein [Clostridiales bacterium]|nr:FMN-binding protein [Clostridiales bacterium]